MTRNRPITCVLLYHPKLKVPKGTGKTRRCVGTRG